MLKKQDLELKILSWHRENNKLRRFSGNKVAKTEKNDESGIMF